MFFYARRQQKRAKEFLMWLHAHAAEVRSGMALWEGQRVGMETRVTRYMACVSLLLVSNKFPSSYVVADQEGGWLVGWMYSLASLLLGWWGLPWGLIWTPTVVYRNLRGGHATTAGALLTSITARAGAAAAAAKA